MLESFKTTDSRSSSVPHSVDVTVGKHSNELSSSLLVFRPRKRFAGDTRTENNGTPITNRPMIADSASCTIEEGGKNLATSPPLGADEGSGSPSPTLACRL